jgi:catechol 2,3-dioxygenase-like lactoylglutathione lyase family enzyme
MIQGVDNIGICVRDLGRTVSFYEKLGFTKAFENDRGCTLIAGSSKLFVFQTKAHAKSVHREFSLFENPPGIDHISFLVDDIDKTYTALKARGIKFSSKPAEQDWGARTVTLNDPDGNNLYLLQWLKR